MAKKKEVCKVKPLNENKKNIIASLIDEYDIQTADDIQAALRDLLGGTIKSMMEAEMMNILAMETMSAVKTVYREMITATIPRGKTSAPQTPCVNASGILTCFLFLQDVRQGNRLFF